LDQGLILITLLIKLGVSAAVSSVLSRGRRFRVLLFREERTVSESLEMVLLIGIPFALGVVVRAKVRNFMAADLALESAILMGIITGRCGGTVGGLLVSLPSLFLHEWGNLPLNVGTGLAAGFLRNLAQDREAIWSFSPLLDLSIYRWIRRTIRKSFIDWQTSFFFMILGVAFLRDELREIFGRRVYGLDSPNWLITAAIYLTSVMCVAIALKVLNNVRIEMKLEEQKRLLLQARMEALQSQINPHFLFNTLNTVSSLVRFNPDKAREVIVKLSSILRRLLRTSDSFVQLKDELEFIDDYLDIEVVRFGPEKLRIQMEVQAETLGVAVPSVILQPLVENSIKHGLSAKIDGGTITLRARLDAPAGAKASSAGDPGGLLVIEVEDDGVGMEGASHGGTGIGLANVRERLQVLYGDSARLEINSQRGQGTLVRLVLPIPQSDDFSSAIYDARSSTPR
jgi:two-component system LytT family sensor kinase